MNTSILPVAAIQMVSTSHLEHNLSRAKTLIAQAAQAGAQLILLPEYFCLMGKTEHDKVAIQETQGEPGPIQTMLADCAKAHRIWLIGGTIPLTIHPATQTSHRKVRNTTLVYNPQGSVVGHYDKIHLFRYQGERTHFDETQTIEAGTQPKALALDTICGTLQLGLSICYDLRFPELYRQLSSHKPLDLIVVPAAFTATTGQAHWEVLLRARAIENQCYVLACAQAGEHDNGRQTWGHSMLIDPWGKIIAQQSTNEGVIRGDIDFAHIATIRKNLPALQHRQM
ncbi:MAG: carbon-nitrogen hydrolase family protein [Ottowia sp.]|nr:carbon-nitrogen hydrolase family protein [Ottowia sp.]